MRVRGAPDGVALRRQVRFLGPDRDRRALQEAELALPNGHRGACRAGGRRGDMRDGLRRQKEEEDLSGNSPGQQNKRAVRVSFSTSYWIRSGCEILLATISGNLFPLTEERKYSAKTVWDASRGVPFVVRPCS